jgi:hypothetical protein
MKDKKYKYLKSFGKMKEKEVRELYEAYLQVHQPQEVVEEVEELDEDKNYDRNRQRAAQRAAARNEARKQGKTGNVPGVGYVSSRPERETYRDSAGVERHTSGARMPKKKVEEETDLFDYILEHLLDEGYADTEEAALKIMANMSEDWRQSIVEAGGAIRADVPQPGQRTVRMTATGKEPAGDRFVRQAGETIGRFLGSRGVQKIEPAPPQRKPLGSTTKPGPSNNFGRGF